MCTNRLIVRFSKTLRRTGRQTGATLIELIVFIVIVSVAAAGILVVMNLTTGQSADPLVRKQAAVVAESLLEEIELHDMIAASGTAAVTTTNRMTVYHVVSDYNGFSTSGGIRAADGTVIPALSNYNVAPAVSVAAIGGGELPGVAAASAVRITVSVTDPTGTVTSLTGYRTAY